jgi:formylmethanofuran dehydrogenase subunit E
MNINIADVKAFHGHMCPGLAIGIRVAEQALLEMGERPGDEEVVAIIETDNCAVDAIQFITGCTFGKGNLIHLDYGKNAFRFIRRGDGKAVRIVVKPETLARGRQDEAGLNKRVREGSASEEDRQSLLEIRRQRTEQILTMPLNELLDVQTIRPEIPHRARIFNSVPCERCGEKTMETRLHLLDGKAYCPECFDIIMSS